MFVSRYESSIASRHEQLWSRPLCEAVGVQEIVLSSTGRTRCKSLVICACRVKKAGAGAEVYLRHYALACHRANEAVGGALEPLYRLHASRLKLLLLPVPDLKAISRYCFFKSTAAKVLSCGLDSGFVTLVRCFRHIEGNPGKSCRPVKPVNFPLIRAGMPSSTPDIRWATHNPPGRAGDGRKGTCPKIQPMCACCTWHYNVKLWHAFGLLSCVKDAVTSFGACDTGWRCATEPARCKASARALGHFHGSLRGAGSIPLSLSSLYSCLQPFG